MLLPDGSVLMHAGAPYDPVKAHAYYIRTRQLHPRTTGGTYTVTGTDGHSVKLTAQELEEQKAYAAARVSQIKKNLSDLGVLLRDKMQQAKESAAKAAKPPTLAEKAQAARTAAKYRAAHPQQIANKAKQASSKAPSSGSSSKSSSTKSDTVDSLKQQMVSARANLKTAVARQRELATAKKNG